MEQPVVFFLGRDFRVLCQKCHKFDVQVRIEIKGVAHILVECLSCISVEAERQFWSRRREELEQ